MHKLKPTEAIPYDATRSPLTGWGALNLPWSTHCHFGIAPEVNGGCSASEAVVSNLDALDVER